MQKTKRKADELDAKELERALLPFAAARESIKDLGALFLSTAQEPNKGLLSGRVTFRREEFDLRRLRELFLRVPEFLDLADLLPVIEEGKPEENILERTWDFYFRLRWVGPEIKPKPKTGKRERARELDRIKRLTEQKATGLVLEVVYLDNGAEACRTVKAKVASSGFVGFSRADTTD